MLYSFCRKFNDNEKPPFQALESAASARLPEAEKTTCIELIGCNCPGLLSEISSVFKDNVCNIVQAQVWSYCCAAAAIVHVTDAVSGAAIEDPSRILTMRKLLHGILRIGRGRITPRATISGGSSHPQQRLHQMMTAVSTSQSISDVGCEIVVSDCLEKNYSVVTMRCPDRPKLLFDTLCTITDMDLVVFHAMILTLGENSFQEYFVQDSSGRRIVSPEEQRRLKSAVMEALQRRGRGKEIELWAGDRTGILSDVTRVLRENGLAVRRAEILTRKEEAEQRFLVWDVCGKEVEGEKVEEIKKKMMEVGDMVAMRVKEKKVATERRAAPLFTLLSVLGLCSVKRLTLIGLSFLGHLS